MAVLPHFRTPGGIADPNPEAWNETVRALFTQFTGNFPQFYDPTEEDTPDDAPTPPIAWTAFPARLLASATSEEGRWGVADNSPNREAQDEYCEWTVERDGDKLIGVTFTTELPEYWDHLAEHDPGRVVALYQELVSSDVEESDLFDQEGRYNRFNQWNTAREGRLAHLIQNDNALSAAVALVAKATVLRERDGVPVTSKHDLVDCANLGEPLRNSDPQIAAAVNDAAASGAKVTFDDPVGLYIRGLETTGMAAPDGRDPAEFWTIERGDAEHALRARFAVPEELGLDYSIGDITVGGRPLHRGAQLADRVSVVINAVVKAGDAQPTRQPCVA